MICKKCHSVMRLWLTTASFKTYECPSCQFVAIEREKPRKEEKGLASLGVVEIERSAGYAERIITRSIDRASRE
jgi:hypothetical protein